MTNPEHDLHTFMAQITHEMASEYDRIYAKTCDDPGTAGDEGEENWATLLREWLPPAYHVATKGRLISSDGRMSPQIDVLVLKPFYPRKLQEKKVWLANGVAAVFECKTTLRAEHISASAERCQAFKALSHAVKVVHSENSDHHWFMESSRIRMLGKRQHQNLRTMYQGRFGRQWSRRSTPQM